MVYEDVLYASGCVLRINSKISDSVSKMINEYNSHGTDQLKQLKLERLIASTINYME
jgi:hypothetical protein